MSVTPQDTSKRRSEKLFIKTRRLIVAIRINRTTFRCLEGGLPMKWLQTLIMITSVPCLGAQPLAVKAEWARHFTDVSLTSVLFDNIGNIAAVGGDETSALAILLNERGEMIAQAS